MPILLDVNELEPGMRLARPLMGKYHTLVTVNRVLTKDDISLLIKHDIKQVAIADPLLENKVKFDDQDLLDIETGQETQRRMAKTLETTQKMFRQTSTISAQELFRLQGSIAECIEYMQSNPVVSAFLDKTQGESAKIDTSRFKFGAEELKLLPQRSVIMHPLPRRDEIATTVDSDPRAMYWRQVRNGMWVRVALILIIFDRDVEVDRYYEDLTR